MAGQKFEMHSASGNMCAGLGIDNDRFRYEYLEYENVRHLDDFTRGLASFGRTLANDVVPKGGGSSFRK